MIGQPTDKMPATFAPYAERAALLGLTVVLTVDEGFLPTQVPVYFLSIHGADPDWVLTGIYSMDRGLRWRAHRDGMPDRISKGTVDGVLAEMATTPHI